MRGAAEREEAEARRACFSTKASIVCDSMIHQSSACELTPANWTHERLRWPQGAADAKMTSKCKTKKQKLCKF